MKYINITLLLSMFLSSTFNGMDTAPHILIWSNDHYTNELTPRDLVIYDLLARRSFNNANTLDYDGDSVTIRTILNTTKQATLHTPHLTPLQQFDCIVITDPRNSRKSSLQKNLDECSKYLSPMGTVLIIGETHNDSGLAQKTLDELYPAIYKAIPKKNHTIDPIRNFTKQLFSLKEFRSIGNNEIFIHTFEQQKYRVFIDNQDLYKNLCAEQFDNAIIPFDLPLAQHEALKQQFIDRIIEQLNEEENYLSESITFTISYWQKKPPC